jgi:hypothetical protein
VEAERRHLSLSTSTTWSTAASGDWKRKGVVLVVIVVVFVVVSSFSLYINYDLNMPSSVGSVSDVNLPPLTVIGIREMGKTRLKKLYKPRLIEAINACMAYINLLQSDKISKVTPALKTLKQRNFKGLERPALMQALDAWP